MRKSSVYLAVVLVLALTFSGCAAGPFKWTNAVNDWGATVYSGDTYLGTLTYYTAVPIAGAVAGVVDTVIINPYYWWGEDVWSGHGTTYDHTGAPNGRKLDKSYSFK